MALTPDTADALKTALDAVIDECGDDPQYAELVENLEQARAAIPDGEPGEAPEPERDSEDDDFSFDTAEKRFREKRKKGREEGDA